MSSFGRERGLLRGANVVMPNLTPTAYRKLYDVYPGKAVPSETVEECAEELAGRFRRIGRVAGGGAGSRVREARPVPAAVLAAY